MGQSENLDSLPKWASSRIKKLESELDRQRDLYFNTIRAVDDKEANTFVVCDDKYVPLPKCCTIKFVESGQEIIAHLDQEKLRVFTKGQIHLQMGHSCREVYIYSGDEVSWHQEPN